MADNIERLFKYIRKEDVVLFIGSGFSIKAGAPRVSQIIDDIIQEGGTSFANSLEKRTLQDVSEAYVNYCGSRNDLMGLLKKLFSFSPSDLSDQQLLRKITHFKTIFTTNYDNLIESAYEPAELTVVHSNVGTAYANATPVTLYKIHGDITTLNDPDSIVITKSDYKEYFKSERFEIMINKLKEMMVEKHIVFIGYSLADDNILSVIGRIKRKIGNNQKQMFLIAPDFDKNEQERLKRNSIAYIDNYAENFLQEVLQNLKDNIVKDYKHQKVCKETFDRFCELNGPLQVTSTNTGKENRIDNVQAANGQKLNTHFTMTFSSVKPVDLKNPPYNCKQRIPNTNFELPALNIPADTSLVNFDFRMGGIRLFDKDEIATISIMPTHKQMRVSVKMPSLKFSEDVDSVAYCNNQNFHLDLDTPICQLKITGALSHNDGMREVLVNMKEDYDNNDTAIKWIKFLIGMLSGEEAFIYGKPVRCNKRNDDAIEVLNKYLDYYQTILAIECNPEVHFTTHHNYSVTNSFNAKQILSYLSGEFFEAKLAKNTMLNLEIDTNDERNSTLEFQRGKECVMVNCEALGTVMLNETSFDIPYRIVFMKNCIPEMIEDIEGGMRRISIREKDDIVEIMCCSKPPRQEGSALYFDNGKIKDYGSKQDI